MSSVPFVLPQSRISYKTSPSAFKLTKETKAKNEPRMELTTFESGKVTDFMCYGGVQTRVGKLTNSFIHSTDDFTCAT
jgi:hypothetical protein